MSTENGPVASNPSMAETTNASFEDLYRSDFRQVLGLAYVLTGNRSAAEEITQEAFTAAYRQWNKVSSYDSPGAWVRRVVCNHAASSLRKGLREVRALLRLSARIQDISLDRSDYEFWQTVRQLPTRQAQAIALHYLEDLTVEQIADVLDCSNGTVKTHLSRARQAITKHLEDSNENKGGLS